MRKIGLFLIGLCMSAAASAQNFNDYFADKTLRLDYIFTGNATRQEICLDELCRSGKIKRGDYILLTAFGGGLTWGAMLIRW